MKNDCNICRYNNLESDEYPCNICDEYTLDKFAPVFLIKAKIFTVNLDKCVIKIELDKENLKYIIPILEKYEIPYQKLQYGGKKNGKNNLSKNSKCSYKR